MLPWGSNAGEEKRSAQEEVSLAMKLLLQGWLLALVLISQLVGLVALAKHYYTQTTIETPPPAVQKSFAIVASDDGEGYQ